MNEIIRGQVKSSAAEVYDEFFLPALFADWPAKVLNAARVNPGSRVLDVACGTGVLTLAAAERVGADGSVIGADINEGMLAVARGKSQTIKWEHAAAEKLPYPDNQFDIVISQFGLMFFEDRLASIQEMMRVLGSGGRMAIAVWDSLENTPGYLATSQLLLRLFGEQAADSLRTPYNLGDIEVLQAVFSKAGVDDIEIQTHSGTARFPSLESWMYTDVQGWTLAGMITDDQFELLLHEAERELSRFVNGDGSVAFDSPAHIVTATKN